LDIDQWIPGPVLVVCLDQQFENGPLIRSNPRAVRLRILKLRFSQNPTRQRGKIELALVPR
jgi:hypothetical protein